MKLDREDVAAIAAAVAARLGDRRAAERQDSVGFVDAAFVARELKVERDWVYDHAEQLGGIRLGGPRGRLRFDIALVKERLGGVEPYAWRAPRRPPRRASARTAPQKRPRRELKSRSRTAKSGRGALERPRPDTGR